MRRGFVFAARHEMAMEPRDFLEVSTSLGLEGYDAPDSTGFDIIGRNFSSHVDCGGSDG